MSSLFITSRHLQFPWASEQFLAADNTSSRPVGSFLPDDKLVLLKWLGKTWATILPEWYSFFQSHLKGGFFLLRPSNMIPIPSRRSIYETAKHPTGKEKWEEESQDERKFQDSPPMRGFGLSNSGTTTTSSPLEVYTSWCKLNHNSRLKITLSIKSSVFSLLILRSFCIWKCWAPKMQNGLPKVT